MDDQTPALAPKPLEQPRLGIGHLMLWTLGAASVLGFFRAFGGTDEQTPLMQTVMVRYQLCFSLLAGINIAAVIVYVRRFVVRDAPLLVQPGHWLLVNAGLANLGIWLLLGIAALYARWEWEDWSFAGSYQGLNWMAYSVGYLLSAGLALLAMLVLRGPLRWQLVFLASAVCSGVLTWTFGMAFFVELNSIPDQTYVANQVYSCIYPLDQFLGVILLAFNMLADRADGTRQDWLHRVGVVTSILQSAASLVFHWLWQWVFASGL